MSIVTRPLIGTMFYLSKGVKVRPQDLANKVVHVPLDEKGDPFDWPLVTGDLFTVETSDSRPDNAFLAVEYRNVWFYIRDDDVISKDTFNLFQMLTALRAGEIPRPITPLTLPIR